MVKHFSDLNEVLYILELLYPCKPLHVLQKILELKNKSKASELRLKNSQNFLVSLTEKRQGRSKSESLAILLAEMKISSEQFLLTHSLTSIDRDKWQAKLHQAGIDLNNWKNEPVRAKIVLPFLKVDD